MADLMKRIRLVFGELSRGEKKVAAHLLERPQDFAFLSVREVARRIQVSTATVVRTAQSLGFSGYGQLQEEAQRAVWSNRFAMRLSAVEPAVPRDRLPSLQSLMQDDVSAIHSTMSRIETDQVERAVRLLACARRILVLGQRMSAGPAEYFGRVMETLLGNVHILGREPGTLFDALVGAGSQDVAVVVAFPRYTMSTVQFAKLASQRGVKLIVVTDGPLSPLVPLAECWFGVASTSSGPVDTYIAAASLLNGIASLAALQNSAHVANRLRELDEVLDQSGTFAVPR